MSVEVELVVDARARVGEGPVWDADEGCLYWVDIEAGLLHRFDGRQDAVVRSFDLPLGAVGLRHGGGLVAALGMGVAALDGTAPPRWFGRVGRGERVNDGGCDPAGGFFFGTLSHRTGAAGLYRFGPEGGIATVLEDVTISNGLDFSPDGTRMYYVDTPSRRIDVFDFDPVAGTPAGRRTFVSFDSVPGNPDGLTVDAAGRVWVALSHGGAVRCYEPSGALAEVIGMPVERVTSLAFGGAGLDELYLTSGSWDFTDADWRAQPHAGGLFRCRPGAVGRLPHRFGRPPAATGPHDVRRPGGEP